MTEHYDLIIIGSGAGGGTLAHRLAPTGKRILLLERGDYLPRERENWDPTAVFVRSKYKAKETWYDRNGRAFHPGNSLLRRRQHQDVWRGAVPAAQGGLRRDQALRRDLTCLAHRIR